MTKLKIIDRHDKLLIEIDGTRIPYATQKGEHNGRIFRQTIGGAYGAS